MGLSIGMVLTTILGVIVLLLLLLKIWHKLLSGNCKSQRKMFGKTAIVTGANTGIGYETALNFAERGARVILACRDHQRGIQARDEIVRRTGNKGVYLLHLDLGSLKSVRDFVAEVKRREKFVHVLVNNAAAAGLPNKKTKDGLQQEMQINHFGPFLLTLLLVDVLKRSAPSRVVVVSSLAHKFARLELDNLNSEKWFSDTYHYSNAKLANILFSNELARRLQNTGVTCNSLHPGVVKTDIGRRLPSLLKAIFGFIIGFACKTAADGAQTSVYLAVSEEVEGVTGKYFADCKEAKMSKTARDEKFAKQLWDECVQLVELTPNEMKI